MKCINVEYHFMVYFLLREITSGGKRGIYLRKRSNDHCQRLLPQKIYIKNKTRTKS